MYKPLSQKQIKNSKELSNIENNKVLDILLLDIEDPVNIGSIIRTSDGLGLTRLYLSTQSYSKLDKGIHITSMGLHRRFEFVEAKDPLQFILDKKREGFCILGLDLTEESRLYTEVPYEEKTLLILGNERAGIYKKYFEYIDQFVHLPMLGKGDSLNVNVAFAVVGYQIICARQ